MDNVINLPKTLQITEIFTQCSDFINDAYITGDYDKFAKDAVALATEIVMGNYPTEIHATVLADIESHLKGWGLIDATVKLSKAIKEGTLHVKRYSADEVAPVALDDDCAFEVDDDGEVIEVKEAPKVEIALAVPAAPVVKKVDFKANMPLNKFPYPITRANKDGDIYVVGAYTLKENTVALLSFYDMQIAYNAMNRKAEFVCPSLSENEDDETILLKFTNIANRCGYKISKQVMNDHFNEIARDNTYHPVRQWIDEATWDGKSRLNELFDTLTVRQGDEPLRNAAVKRFLVSVARALYSREASKLENVLVFVGEQGIGKTSWFKGLFPSTFKAVLDGHCLDPHSKDNVALATAHLVTELGELDSTFKKDIGGIKAFLSKEFDEYRAAYAVRSVAHKRQTVFCASVNKDDFLVDDTGNRRFMNVTVQAINFKHGIDMQQVWAEVKTMYEAGEQWWPTADEAEMFGARNKEHELVDPIEQAVVDNFYFSKDLTGYIDGGSRPKLGLTVTQIFEYLNINNPTKGQLSTLKAVLKKHTGQEGTYARHGTKGYQLFALTDYTNSDDRRSKFFVSQYRVK